MLINTSGTGGSGGSSASGATGQGSGNQFFIGGGGGNQVQGGTNLPARRITIGTGSRVGVILYFVALLVSLAAAVGMLFTKHWGRVLAIIMGVLYGLLGLVSLLPLLLIRFVGSPNPVDDCAGNRPRAAGSIGDRARLDPGEAWTTPRANACLCK